MMTFFKTKFALFCQAVGLLSMLAMVPKVTWGQQASVEDTSKDTPYKTMLGHKVAASKFGELNIRVYTYVRYLNQLGLDSSYVDGFGRTQSVDRRQDIQIQKVSIYFTGWAFDPKLNYFLYVWTSNSSQGQDAQVVVAGNLTYNFDKHFKLTAGIMSLPGVRTTEGIFPYWLSVDNRMICDEFMRPSYTSGIQAKGEVVKKLNYMVMLGNNMSTLGVDAGQLDAGMNTLSAALIFLPTTGEYGMFNGSYGDYDEHQKVATRLGAHYTRSNETRQGQPSNDAFENVQLRVSDGTSIFSPGIFASGSQVDEARDQMFCIDGGAKYKGFALEGEYYWRRIDQFKVIGNPMPINQLRDDGFQLLASAMVFPKKLQLYGTYSKINGEYGIPSEWRIGFNYFPFIKTNSARLNAQAIFLDKSPVGGLAYPYAVGGNGVAFNIDFELNF